MKRRMLVLLLVNTLNGRSLFSPSTNEYVRFRKHHIEDATQARPDDSAPIINKQFLPTITPHESSAQQLPAVDLDQIFNFTRSTCNLESDHLRVEVETLSAKNRELQSACESCKQQNARTDNELADYHKRVEKLEHELDSKNQIGNILAQDKQELQQKIDTLIDAQEHKLSVEKIHELELRKQITDKELEILTEKNQELMSILEHCKGKKRLFKRDALRVTELEHQLQDLQQKNTQELANYRTKIEALEHELSGKQHLCDTDKQELQHKIDELNVTHEQVHADVEQENKALQEKLHHITMQEQLTRLESETLAAKNKELTNVLEHCKEKRRQLKNDALRMVELEHQLQELPSKMLNHDQNK